jgi:hypothetical protein
MSHRHTPWTVRSSAILYRRLLLLYPRAFRQQFAADLAQVFMDVTGEAYQRDGAMGVLGAWGRALPDLAATVLAERSVQMGDSTLMQLGGLCLMLGSSLGDSSSSSIVWSGLTSLSACKARCGWR